MTDQTNNPNTGEESVTARRHFLRLAGKAAVYTPPVMLGLSAPSMKAIASSATGQLGQFGSGSKPAPRTSVIQIQGGQKASPSSGGIIRQINSLGNNRGS